MHYTFGSRITAYVIEMLRNCLVSLSHPRIVPSANNGACFPVL